MDRMLPGKNEKQAVCPIRLHGQTDSHELFIEDVEIEKEDVGNEFGT